jgi:hypothetical protein
VESGPGVDLWVRFPKAAPPFGLVISHVAETGPWHATSLYPRGSYVALTYPRYGV